MVNNFNNTENQESANILARKKIINNLIEISKKDQESKNSIFKIEMLMEELFYHIAKFSDDELKNGKIRQLTESDIASGEYNITIKDLAYFNDLVIVLNKLFKIYIK
jgi:hypothetical protein